MKYEKQTVDILVKLEQIVIKGLESSRYVFKELRPVDGALIECISAISVCPLIIRSPEGGCTLSCVHGGSQERWAYIELGTPWWVTSKSVSSLIGRHQPTSESRSAYLSGLYLSVLI